MTSRRAPASRYDRRINIEQPVADSSLDGAGSGSWQMVAQDVAAEVKDELPSRAERLNGGVVISARRARVRMRFREDVAANMRFVMGNRLMQIISGPAEVGRREELEFMVEDFSPSGNTA